MKKAIVIVLVSLLLLTGCTAENTNAFKTERVVQRI